MVTIQIVYIYSRFMRFQAPESLSEQIAQHLGQRIMTGELRPGERIQELKVAGELNVSRGSVREALLITPHWPCLDR